MSPWSPCKRKDFILRLCRIGFEGPFSGTRHHFMVFKEHRMAIPSNREYSIPQLRMMIKEIEGILGRKISDSEWNNL